MDALSVGDAIDRGESPDPRSPGSKAEAPRSWHGATPTVQWIGRDDGKRRDDGK
jgi:hypothetical protein